MELLRAEHMPGPPAAVSFFDLRPRIEQPNRTRRMGCLGSYLGANHTQKIQSPDGPGACLTGRVGGAGLHRPLRGAQVTQGVISAVCRSAGRWGRRESESLTTDARQYQPLAGWQGGRVARWIRAQAWGMSSEHLSGSLPHL